MAGLRVLIEGIGGIGGVVAGELIRAGGAPTLVTHNREITAAIAARGLRVTTPGGSFTVQAKAVTTLAELPSEARFDVALLIMKAGAVVEAARETLPYLADDGFLVTCQNGVVEDAVLEVVEARRLVSGIIAWGGTLLEPGSYQRTSPGETILGELDGSMSERLRELGRLLTPVAPVRLSANIRGALWAKLAVNCTITSLGALTGETLGEMLRDRRARVAFLEIYREVVDTAAAEGIELERVGANPKLLYVPRTAGALSRWVKDVLVRVVGRKYGGVKSSSLQSLQRGRPTEIDYLNGHVVRRATAAGVAVPFNATLVRLIEAIESGDRAIEPANMEALLAAGETR